MENTSKWNQPQKAAKRTKSGVTVWRGVIAALVVVVGAAVAFWFVGGRDNGGPAASKGSKSIPLSLPNSSVSKPTGNPDGSKDGKSAESGQNDEDAAKSEAANKAAAAAEEARIKKWKDKFAKRRSIFTNASDQVLGMIASAPPGRDMPPMPITPSIDRDFMRSLDTPIVIDDADSDEIKALKEAVMKLRVEVLEIKESQGLSVYEILTQHQDLVRENASLRIEAQKAALEIYKSGDVEGARDYVDTANVLLQKLGAEPIKMPGGQNEELRQHIRNRLDNIKKKQ